MTMRGKIKKVNPKEVMLENILAVTDGLTFGRDTAAKIVGGLQTLLSLIADGKIEAWKDPTKKNGKWFCNARQVLMYARNARA